MEATTHDTTPVSPVLRVYRPVKRRFRISDIWTSFGVARMIGLRDIKTKYKQAALGPLWLLIGPLGMLAAITIAFSGVTKTNTGDVPYVLFALVGLVVWTFISLSASLGAQAIVSNSGLVRRSPIPRIALISGCLLGNFPPVAVMFAITLIGTVIDRGLPLQALLLPLLIAWLFVFTLSVAMVLGALAARFRDTVSVLPLIIQAGIFVSPVGYPLKGAPQHIHTLLIINPVSGLIEAWRWALLGMPGTEWGAVAVAGVWTVVFAVLGYEVFARLEVNFADFV
jgi:ABC-type polysaccharide/polyol phosphate export permease